MEQADAFKKIIEAQELITANFARSIDFSGISAAHQAIVEADGPEARISILTDRRDDILDDCEKALAPVAHEWAVECLNAIAAMRANLE